MTICLLLGVHASEEPENGKPALKKLLCPLELLGLPSPGGVTGAYHYANMQRLELLLTKRNILPLSYDKTKPYPVKISVEVEALTSVRLSVSELPNVTAFNVSRLKDDAIMFFDKRWNQLGGDSGIFKGGTKTPDVFKALRKREAFKHIKLFIYPVSIDGEVITMATYYGDIEDLTINPHL